MHDKDLGIGLGMHGGRTMQQRFKVLGCWQGSLDVQDLRVRRLVGKRRRGVSLTRQGRGLDVGKTKAEIKLSVGSMLVLEADLNNSKCCNKLKYSKC